ncbi:Pyridoxal 5'-phosphate synthase subunit PdxS [Methanosarcinaceae archaeon Ag5]|uniref:pyridoxal 5'-phosphate synthase (glutamine hydrolyzing) n=1 Tax=Methanolapillus africanus TaxID=3028297 RepID=A0AAE4SDH7_9EURY|nr:Pyridoxal 5'-phosphate synthase subunit PdxS [Methanosarcinaceae archaeon Ag5]
MVDLSTLRFGNELLARGFEKLGKCGVICDVSTPDQAQLAEECGAAAVMVTDSLSVDSRARSGVMRMANVETIEAILTSVSIPVMGKVRVGHFVEAEILQALGIAMIDESEALSPASLDSVIDKTKFNVPFITGATNLGEALRSVSTGTMMIRVSGQVGSGNIAGTVQSQIQILKRLAELLEKSDEERAEYAKTKKISEDLLAQAIEMKRLPVLNYAAGGIATPADAALMMKLGCDGVFVGSGIFKAEHPELMGKAIVEAVKNYDKPDVLAKISKGIGSGMRGAEATTDTKK